MGKSKSFFDSLWFNAIMSIVAVVALGIHVMERSYVRVLIWIIIAYHFILGTNKARNRLA